MKKTFSIVLVASFAHLALAFPLEGPREKVIYGEDDRKEVYEVEDPILRRLAQSTALVIKSDKLESINDSELQVQGSHYGESYDLCSEEPFREQSTAGFCSAFLVAPNKLATAGHCIEDISDCESARFVFGFAYDSPQRDLRTVSKSAVYSCKRIIERKAHLADYALIELDRTVEGIEALKLAQEPVANGDLLEVVGHPAGIPSKVGEGFVRSIASKDFILTNLDTYGGNSGSAVLRKSDHAVVGILVRGEEDFSYRGSCRISKRCSDEGCRGEDVTRIQYITQALQKAK